MWVAEKAGILAYSGYLRSKGVKFSVAPSFGLFEGEF